METERVIILLLPANFFKLRPVCPGPAVPSAGQSASSAKTGPLVGNALFFLKRLEHDRPCGNKLFKRHCRVGRTGGRKTDALPSRIRKAIARIIFIRFFSVCKHRTNLCRAKNFRKIIGLRLPDRRIRTSLYLARFQHVEYGDPVLQQEFLFCETSCGQGSRSSAARTSQKRLRGFP